MFPYFISVSAEAKICKRNSYELCTGFLFWDTLSHAIRIWLNRIHDEVFGGEESMKAKSKKHCQMSNIQQPPHAPKNVHGPKIGDLQNAKKRRWVNLFNSAEIFRTLFFFVILLWHLLNLFIGFQSLVVRFLLRMRGVCAKSFFLENVWSKRDWCETDLSSRFWPHVMSYDKTMLTPTQWHTHWQNHECASDSVWWWKRNSSLVCRFGCMNFVWSWTMITRWFE